jgi:hypothetical protein
MTETRTVPRYKVGEVELGLIGERANWHQGTMIGLLREAGLSLSDAECYAAFIANEYCAQNDGQTDTRSEDYLTDDQWNRLESL